MLRQILKDLYIDPELLSELSEEQKQVLFIKMREEQVRRWKVHEEELVKKEEPVPPKKTSKNKKGTNVHYMIARDGNPWVWVFGESDEDASEDEKEQSLRVLEDKEAERKAKEIAEKEAEELRKKELGAIELRASKRKIEQERIQRDCVEKGKLLKERRKIFEQNAQQVVKSVSKTNMLPPRGMQLEKKDNEDAEKKKTAEFTEQKRKEEEQRIEFGKKEAEKKRKEEADLKKRETERKQKVKAEMEKRETERKQREAAELEKRETERKQREEAELEKKETERKQREKAELEKREIERKQREEAELEKREIERKKKEEADRKNFEELRRKEHLDKEQREKQELARKEAGAKRRRELLELERQELAQKAEEKRILELERQKREEEKRLLELKEMKEKEEEERRAKEQELKEKQEQRTREIYEKIKQQRIEERHREEEQRKKDYEAWMEREKRAKEAEFQRRSSVSMARKEVKRQEEEVKELQKQGFIEVASGLYRRFSLSKSKVHRVDVKQESMRRQRPTISSPELISATGVPTSVRSIKPPKPERSPPSIPRRTSRLGPAPPPPVNNGEVVVQKRTARPQNRQQIIEWWQEVELAKGAGFDVNDVYPWFHGIITRQEAESLLEDKPVSSFLVRVSERVWGYTISYRAVDRCKHFLIDTSDNTYQFFGHNQIAHASLADLVKFHQTKPVSGIGKEVLLNACGQKDVEPDYKELISQNTMI